MKELLALKGREETERYIIKEVQKIYFSQGSLINDKHIEIIIKQMFSRVKIKDSGDAPDLVVGEIVEKSKFLEINRDLKKQGLQPAKAQQLLMGVKRVALSTESWLSAASFEDTARILVTAGLEGKSDSLRGLKENVIIGRLIPTRETFNMGGEVKEEEEKGITETAEEEVIEEAESKSGAEEEGQSLTDETKSDNV